MTLPGTDWRGGWSFWGREWGKHKEQDKQAKPKHSPKTETHFSLGNVVRSFHYGWIIRLLNSHSYFTMGGLWPVLSLQNIHWHVVLILSWPAEVWRAVGRGTCVCGVGIFLCFKGIPWVHSDHQISPKCFLLPSTPLVFVSVPWMDRYSLTNKTEEART